MGFIALRCGYQAKSTNKLHIKCILYIKYQPGGYDLDESFGQAYFLSAPETHTTEDINLAGYSRILAMCVTTTHFCTNTKRKASQCCT